MKMLSASNCFYKNFMRTAIRGARLSGRRRALKDHLRVIRKNKYPAVHSRSLVVVAKSRSREYSLERSFALKSAGGSSQERALL